MTTGDPSPGAHKPRQGISRLVWALRHSIDGLCAATRHESAIRQELAIVVPLSIVAWFVPVDLFQRAILFGVLQLVLIVELLNSAIEANTDHITLERHPLAKRAKDMGSAAVLLALIVAGVAWGAILWQRFG